MGVLETCRCCPVPLEVRFLSGSQVSAARGGLRLIQAPRLLVDFAKSSGVLQAGGRTELVEIRGGRGRGQRRLGYPIITCACHYSSNPGKFVVPASRC